jgi:hypothetical protein
MMVHVVGPDGVAAEHRFTGHDGVVSETGGIVLRVPPRLGEHVWQFSLPAHEIKGRRYAEATLTLAIQARPQASSLAVWDVPSPVVAGERFMVKVGAKSSVACELAGLGVEIRDASGAIVARGSLGAKSWPGTAGLYWTTLELQAPDGEGLCSWSVTFDAGTLDVPHDGAASTFTIATVRPPDHTLTIKVIEQDTAGPVAEALVRLGPYRAETGRTGMAEIRLPKGCYEVNVWKVGYEIVPKTLELDRDVSIEIVALATPEEDPDARWKM